MNPNDSEPVEVPITNELDLHTFRPRDVPELLEEYFRLCREKGISEVRVIHGKGIGTLRERVHALCRQWEDVVDGFSLAGGGSGGWGATWVRLKPLPPGETGAS